MLQISPVFNLTDIPSRNDNLTDQHPDITFSSVPKGTVDPDQVLKDIQDSDHSPEKVSLSAGVYRDAQGNVNEFEVVRKVRSYFLRGCVATYEDIRPRRF